MSKENIAEKAFAEMDVNKDGKVLIIHIRQKLVYDACVLDVYFNLIMQVSSEEFVTAVLGQEQFSKMLTLEIMNIFIDGSK